jgi:hypothetical protein
VPHVGARGIRHRSATDMANSGILVKVSMMLTANKTAGIFMRYVHTEDDPMRKATELVANWRRTIIGAQPSAEVMA